MVNEDLLLSHGADYKKYTAGEVVFREGEAVQYYFQVMEGSIKLNNYNEKGKEFIQRIVSKSQGLLENSAFSDKLYPANAVTMEDCVLLRLPKNNYLSLIRQNPVFYEEIISSLSEQLHYHYIMMNAISSQNPENRLKTLMDYLKGHCDDQAEYSLQIPFTRQQLASLTGLSVETVIRVIKMMEKNQILQIQNRKILY